MVIPVCVGFVRGGDIWDREEGIQHELDVTDANMASTYFAGAIGAGVKFPIAVGDNRIHVGVEANYQLGFTDTYSKKDLYDNDRTVVHEGKLKFRFVNETVNAFLHNRQSRSPVGGDFHVNNEFPEVCYDYSKTCIFTNEEFITPEMDEMKNKVKAKQFQFFVGKDNFPFKDIKAGACVIYSAKRDGIIVVSDPSKVSTQLDRVVDGTAKFKSLGDFQYTAEL